MDFRITLIGLNHRAAGVDIRERFSLSDYCKQGPWPLPQNASEALILSTCNRVELLTIGSGDEKGLVAHWADIKKADAAELRRYIYAYHDLDAARHIFEVASSLDSMVLGEPQILGQIKAAYRASVENRAAGPVLSRLMHKAFSVAKRVRHETAVAANAVSISYAAVELAKRIFGSMPSHRAMLLGAGEMGELAAMHLIQAGIDEIMVVNRTLAHGEALASRFHGRALPFENLEESLKDADIIIASTSSKDPVLNAAAVKKAMKARKNRPMFFIDIAVPRDIDPDVNELDNVYLYDIDDLRDVVEENMAGRKAEAERAKRIVEEEVANFGAWLENLAVEPTIIDLIRRGEKAAEAGLARALKRLGPVDENTRETLRLMALGIAKKMNHEPLMYLKSSGMGADPRSRIGAVRRVFNLDDNRDNE